MSSIGLQQAFDFALRFHRAGQLSEAEQQYRQILLRHPKNADALHLLGTIALQAGKNETATNLIQRAVDIRPIWPEAHNNLGVALSRLGLIDQAITEHREAISQNPSFAEAHCNLGNALKKNGAVHQAIDAYQQAIAFKPKYVEAHYNLGLAMVDDGQIDQAIAAFRQVIALKPDSADAFNNLGFALQHNRQFEEAMAAYRQALVLRPIFPEVHLNIGNVLKLKGRLDEAIASYRQAIALKPDFADAHCDLGTALMRSSQPDEAIESLRRATSLNPNHVSAFGNLGNALVETGQPDEAIAAFRKAIALRPDYASAHGNLIATMLCHPKYSDIDIARDLSAWYEQNAQPLKNLIQTHTNDRNPDRRVRVGYVTAEFRDRVVGRNLVPLFENHDHQNFEIFCYSHAPQPDAMTVRFRSCADCWRDTTGLSDEQVAAQIREDRIDILVDLALHTSGNRLLIFARKPAPIQATFAGYPGTTGLPTIDYRLSDPHLDSPGIDETIYTEKTIRLPHSFWCYHPLDTADIPVKPLPALKNGFITFGCLNNFRKVNDDVLSLWAKVMQQIAGSRLLLLASPGGHRQRAIDRLAREGISPDRLAFTPQLARRQYLELYSHIDIGLDSFPYNGHTTSLDSFWMGVPVVTLSGEKTVSRAGVSLLANLGLSELTATTSTDFIRIATSLARDISALAQRRLALRGIMQHSPLMNAPQFARDIETAYRDMWRTWSHANAS